MPGTCGKSEPESAFAGCVLKHGVPMGFDGKNVVSQEASKEFVAGSRLSLFPFALVALGPILYRRRVLLIVRREHACRPLAICILGPFGSVPDLPPGIQTSEDLLKTIARLERILSDRICAFPSACAPGPLVCPGVLRFSLLAPFARRRDGREEELVRAVRRVRSLALLYKLLRRDRSLGVRPGRSSVHKDKAIRHSAALLVIYRRGAARSSGVFYCT